MRPPNGAPDANPVGNAYTDLLVALVLLAGVAFLIADARSRLSHGRRLVLDERNRRIDADDLAEQRRVQLDGALEELHAATEKIKNLEKAKRPPARTPRKT